MSRELEDDGMLHDRRMKMQRKLRKCALLSMPSLRPCNAKTEVEAPFAVAKDLQNIFLGSDSLSISLLALLPVLAALNYDQMATNRTRTGTALQG